MKNKKKVSLHQIMAGAILKFGKLDSVDVTLLMGGMAGIADIKMDNCYDDYFILANGEIILNEEKIKSRICYTDEEYSKYVLRSMQGDIVKKYLDNLDMIEFILRKIRMFGKSGVVKDELNIIFSDIQMISVIESINNGLIEIYVHEDLEYGNYDAIRLTSDGKKCLFMKDYERDVRMFKENVSHDYGFLLFDEYLDSLDYDMNVDDILNFDRFEKYCNEYVGNVGECKKRMRN